MNRDLEIKTMQLSFTEKTAYGTGRSKQITITEKDRIDLDFRYKKEGAKKTRVYGEVLKIGIDDDNRTYLTIIAFNYSEDNLFKVHTDEIIKIYNIVHSTESYSFQPVINPDESAILIKAVDGVLFFSKDGETWIAAGGSGTGDDSGKAYTESGTLNDQSTSDTVPTSNVVYATIIEQIENHDSEIESKIDDKINAYNETIEPQLNLLDTKLNGFKADMDRSFDQMTRDINNSFAARDRKIGEVEASIQTTKDEILQHVEELISNIGDGDIYNDCVSAGWNGTREDFASILLELVNHAKVIPTVDDKTEEP